MLICCLKKPAAQNLGPSHSIILLLFFILDSFREETSANNKRPSPSATQTSKRFRPFTVVSIGNYPIYIIAGER